MSDNVAFLREKSQISGAKASQRALAEYFVHAQLGEKILSVRELAIQLNMSVGAVSSAINTLEDQNAVTIVKRGHLGSYLTQKSYEKLWLAMERGSMVIAMSLPMHIRFEGLASGIKSTLEQSGVEAYLIFIRGSKNRMKALHENRCHAVVMSALSYANSESSDENKIIHTLPPKSWISDYAVFSRKDSTHKGKMRVGIDWQSSDHIYLTDLEFGGMDIETVSISYVHILQLLRNGDIDTFVWNKEQMEGMLNDDILCSPLSAHALKAIGDKAYSAVFVGKSDDDVIGAVLRELVNPEEVIAIQNQVVERKILPSY